MPPEGKPTVKANRFDNRKVMKVELKSYDPVVVPMPARGVDDKQVKDQMNRIVAQIPCYADVTDEPVGPDSRAKVRLTMRENGAVLPGLDGAELTLTVGDGFFPRALTDGMVGMMPGESRHIAWSAASVGAQDESDASAACDADVEVLSVRARVKPAMTDEWVAAHIPRCSTLDEFYEDVRAQLADAADEQWRAMKRERCAVLLAQRLDGTPAQADIDRASAGVRDNFDRACAREGKLRAEKAAEMGLDEASLDALFAQQGALVAAQGDAVRLYARHFGVEPDEADVERAVKAAFPDAAAAKSFLAAPGGRERAVEMARYERALDLVVGSAVVVDESETEGGEGARGEIANTPYPNPFA